MAQQHVLLERLRRDIAYHVADLRKAQRRRLNRLRDDLRYSPLPADQLHQVFSTIAQLWDDAFTRLERDLMAQSEDLIANGIDYATMRTELTRLATMALHNLLDADLTPGAAALGSPLDRALYLAKYAWNAVLLVALIASVVFAGLGTLSVAAAVAIVTALAGIRVLFGMLSAQRKNTTRDHITVLSDHLNLVTQQACAEMEHLPDVLARAFEHQHGTA